MRTRPWLPAVAVTAALAASVRAAEAPAPPTLTMDAARTREPISPYVYGQFIEHLGRCIYGGMWAEMLEDRKFFYPVDGRMPAWEMFTPGPRSWDGEGHPYELLVRSPWMVIGDPAAVSMDKQSAYAGEHTPVVRLAGKGAPGGLVQERLGLRRGPALRRPRGPGRRRAPRRRSGCAWPGAAARRKAGA